MMWNLRRRASLDRKSFQHLNSSAVQNAQQTHLNVWPREMCKNGNKQQCPWKKYIVTRYMSFDLVTLRSIGYVDPVYSYLWYEYGDHQRLLRLSKSNFKVWPWTSIIWPWLWPRGHWGMLTVSIPTYGMNIVTIKGHYGCLSPISKFDLWSPLSDLEGKNSKFRLIKFFAWSLRTYLCVLRTLLSKL